MAAGDRKDPYLSFNFRVEADQEVLGGFNEIDGLEIETECEKFTEGGVNAFEQQLPGPSKYPTRLVLKGGMTEASKLLPWYKDVMQGRITRKTVSIYMQDSAGKQQCKWVFRGAVPVKWAGPHLRAATNEVAIESLELVHKGLVPD